MNLVVIGQDVGEGVRAVASRAVDLIECGRRCPSLGYHDRVVLDGHLDRLIWVPDARVHQPDDWCA